MHVGAVSGCAIGIVFVLLPHFFVEWLKMINLWKFKMGNLDFPYASGPIQLTEIVLVS